MQNAGKYLSVEKDDQTDVHLFKSSYMFLASELGLDILNNNCNIQR